MYNKIAVWFAGLSPVSQQLGGAFFVGLMLWMLIAGFSLMKSLFIIAFIGVIIYYGFIR